ncbi:uncharacterized protein BO96DRAFT_338341 [Aspergillus niger CBS 101883]|uniref:Contig An08c0010, genomic contig n=2 Tax=Aspergillus niger TaxID=5061 RepID=A2QPT8_ASPNC|nr:uncharacterized protein BO96DRAFT_338341 [Aspergillus niger CBS 101883]XP_059601120.1 uncharacterized protein An08g00160 [Aspergillus niger]PYH56401.1 hypothetical protein BO96DRAFT_338341 [Aspergillus niger CBS 101883]CAK39773.1 unnamed protein product [Aspergillus niger]
MGCCRLLRDGIYLSQPAGLGAIWFPQEPDFVLTKRQQKGLALGKFGAIECASDIDISGLLVGLLSVNGNGELADANGFGVEVTQGQGALAKGPNQGREGRSKSVDPDLCQMTTDEISEAYKRVIVVIEWEGVRNRFFIQCVAWSPGHPVRTGTNLSHTYETAWTCPGAYGTMPVYSSLGGHYGGGHAHKSAAPLMVPLAASNLFDSSQNHTVVRPRENDLDLPGTQPLSYPLPPAPANTWHGDAKYEGFALISHVLVYENSSSSKDFVYWWPRTVPQSQAILSGHQ